jgi:hypothetical protein
MSQPQVDELPIASLRWTAISVLVIVEGMNGKYMKRILLISLTRSGKREGDVHIDDVEEEEEEEEEDEKEVVVSKFDEAVLGEGGGGDDREEMEEAEDKEGEGDEEEGTVEDVEEGGYDATG